MIEERTQGHCKDQQEVGNDGPGLADQQNSAPAKAIRQTPKPGRCQHLGDIVGGDRQGCLKRRGVKLPHDKHWDDRNDGHGP